MAKKKKNEEIIRIVDRELYPTVIGVVDDTEKKPIFLIVIFIILIGLLFGLPYITDFYTNLKGDTLGGSSSNTTKNNTNDNTKDNVDVGVDNSDAPFYLVATSNSVKYDDIEIINLSFTSLTSKDYISLTIKNTTDKAFEINDKNYYKCQNQTLNSVAEVRPGSAQSLRIDALLPLGPESSFLTQLWTPHHHQKPPDRHLE